MYQVAVDFGPHRHFDEFVVHITVNPRMTGQFHALAGMYISVHRAIQVDMRHTHLAFNAAMFAQAQNRRRTGLGGDITLADSITVQTTRKMDITL